MYKFLSILRREKSSKTDDTGIHFFTGFTSLQHPEQEREVLKQDLEEMSSVLSPSA